MPRRSQDARRADAKFMDESWGRDRIVATALSAVGMTLYGMGLALGLGGILDLALFAAYTTGVGALVFKPGAGLLVWSSGALIALGAAAGIQSAVLLFSGLWIVFISSVLTAVLAAVTGGLSWKVRQKASSIWK